MTAAPAPRPFHVGLTDREIIAAAADLTRASHLLTWSMRDLADALGVSPSVVYHHVGGKDAVCRAVADRVIGSLVVPEAEGASWRDWFRTLLTTRAALIAEHPGVASWMLMHGPTIPSSSVILERGLGLLLDAGFGSHAPAAYALLLNTAMTTIAVSDDRRRHEADGARDHATMMAEFERVHDSSPTARTMGRDFIGAFAAGGATAERTRWAYYDFAIDTVLDGLAALLDSDPVSIPSTKEPAE